MLFRSHCQIYLFPIKKDTTCPFCGRDAYLEGDGGYCNSCRCIFVRGCKHSDDVYNASLMVGFRDNVTGNRYNGMLQFDNQEKAELFYHDVKIGKVTLYLQHTCGGWKNRCYDKQVCDNSEEYEYRP